MRLISVLLLLASGLGAQSTNPINDALMELNRLKLEDRKLDLERQRIELERGRTAAPKADAKSIERATAELDKAIRDLTSRYPDFREYESEMPRFGDLVIPGTASIGQYVECLYLLAKYASFSAIARSKQATKGDPMHNEDVIALVQAGMGDEVIIAKIRGSAGAYRLNAADLIDLRRSRVSDPVLKAMLDSGQ